MIGDTVVRWIILTQVPLMLLFIAGTVYIYIRAGESRAHKIFTIACAACCIWGTGQLVRTGMLVFAPNMSFEAHMWAYRLTYIGLCAIGPATLIFAWVYTGNHRLYRNKKIIKTLVTTGTAFYIAYATDPLHNLYYRTLSAETVEYGTLMWIFLVWSYLLLGAGFFTIAKYQWQTNHRTVIPISFAFSVPMLTNFAFIFVPDQRIGLTALALCFTFFATYRMLLHHRVVNLSPLAAKAVFDELPYPVVVVSEDLGDVQHPLSDNPYVLSHNAKAREMPDLLHSHDGEKWRRRDKTLFDGNRIIIFIDVEEYNRLRGELDRQNNLLESLNIELKEKTEALKNYSDIIKDLAAREERNKVINKLNSEVYVLLHKLLENTKKAVAEANPNPEHIKANIELTKQGIETVRRIVRDGL